MEFLKINGNDYSSFVEAKGYGWSRNDLDSDKTGRTKDGKLRRIKVTTKRKLSYKVFHMTREQLAQLDNDLSLETVEVTYLDLHGERTGEFYCSSFSVDMEEIDADGVTTHWSGATFTLTEI